ncbi:hypothetical protein LCGC14_1260230, partial [marine sediment metagenome]
RLNQLVLVTAAPIRILITANASSLNEFNVELPGYSFPAELYNVSVVKFFLSAHSLFVK